jgi:hypothetical protein
MCKSVASEASATTHTPAILVHLLLNLSLSLSLCVRVPPYLGLGDADGADDKKAALASLT